MEKRIFTAILALCGWTGAVLSQVQDSLENTGAVEIQADTMPVDTATLALPVPDSLQPKKGGFFYRIFKKDYPNPNKALLLSAIIPGAGQMYNKRWWKVPIVYGAYVGLIYLIDYNTSYYHEFRDAYIAELHNLPHKYSDTRLTANDLKRYRDSFDKNKQLSYIGLVAVHLVQAAEAFVDCHLKTFDVSDDLSFGIKVKPAFGALETGEPYYGLGLAIGFD